MAQQINLYQWVADVPPGSGVQGIGIEGGLAGNENRVLAVNSGATGLVFTTFSGITGVTGTSPIIVSSSDNDRIVSLAGLTGVGGANTVVMSNGTSWFYNGVTGTGSVVRSASPTITGTLTAAAIAASGNIVGGSGLSIGGATSLAGLTVTGSATFSGTNLSLGGTNLGFFGQTPIARPSAAQSLPTDLSNPALEPEAFRSEMFDLLYAFGELRSALGDTGGLGLVDDE